MYREIASIVKNDSPNCGTPEGGEDLLHQELTNCEIDYYQYHCSDCSQSLCLDIKNKIKYLDKLYILVETLNTKNEDIDKCCGVSTDFISKLTNFLFTIIGEKASTNIPWSKMNWLKKMQCWHVGRIERGVVKVGESVEIVGVGETQTTTITGLAPHT